jgi:hypothetical protein
MSTSYFRRGEMAPLSDKNDGNEHPGAVPKYTVVISYDGTGEFYTRVTVSQRDFNFRALSLPELKRQITLCFPTARFSYALSRSAATANERQRS